MTGMDHFLAQHYGSASSVVEPTAEDVEKVAQAEFFLKLAAKNGIDINSLNDEQINHLWSQMYSKEASAPAADNATVSQAQAEYEHLKEAQSKEAEAREMGKIMAQSYVENLNKMAAAGALDFLKVAAEEKKEKKEEEKEEGALDRVAAEKAVEKASAAGWNAEEAAQRLGAVLTLGPAASEKIAHVSDFASAVDVRSSELLELAGYPIDWSGTQFEKSAKREVHVTPLGGPLATIPKEEKPAPGVGKRLREAAATVAAKTKDLAGKGKDLAKAHPWRTRAAALGTAAALGAGTYGASKLLKKKEEEKTSSVQFDVAAAELAVQKVAAAGWDAEEATTRLNSLFNLGYEGDPAASEKVAAAQTQEQALDLRACELLELAGYPITW